MSKNGKIGAAVVGLGVGMGHIEGYEEDPRSRVVAICDTDEERLECVRREKKIAQATTRFEDLLANDDVQVISICTPDWLHTPQAVAAMRAGKHVFVEKPVATSWAELDELVAATRATERVFSCNLVLRACPRFQEVYRLARGGYFGDIFYVEGDYIHDCSAIMEIGWRRELRHRHYNVTAGGGVHMVDLLRWLTADEVEEVTCYGNGMGGLYDDAPDTMVSILKFRRGCVGKTLSTLAPRRPYFPNLQVYGRKATFINQNGPGKLYTGDTEEAVMEMHQAFPGIRKGDLIKCVLDAIEGKAAPAPDILDVARTLAVCLAAMDSYRSGRPIAVKTDW